MSIAVTYDPCCGALDKIFDRPAPITSNRYLAALKAMFAWAIERGMLDASPIVGLKPPAEETPRERTLDHDELRAVWKASESFGFPATPLVKLLILLGQRIGETSAMKWSDLDLDAATWVIPLSDAKNKKEHLVPLSRQALEIIENLPRIDDPEHVLPGNRGDKPVASSSYIKRKLVAWSGITGWTFHDIRRTFSTGMAEMDIPLHVTERILNHQGGVISGVAKVYNKHEYKKEKR